jgi:hypothetical protein
MNFTIGDYCWMPGHEAPSVSGALAFRQIRIRERSGKKQCTHGNTQPWGRQTKMKKNETAKGVIGTHGKGHNMAPIREGTLPSFQQNPPLLETTKQYQNKVRMNLLGAVQ